MLKPPALCLDHGLTTSIYYRDPEGNYVELQCDAFGNWALSAEWMRTSPAFAAKPIGVFFDAAKVYDRFQTGIDFRELQKEIRSEGYTPNPIPNIGLPG